MNEETVPTKEEHRVEEQEKKVFFPYGRLDNIPELKYLTSETSARLRPIMRYLFQNFNRQRYWVNLSEIWEHVRHFYRQDATEQDCVEDLEILISNGNLRKEYERQFLRTLDEFLHRRVIFQLTALSVEIERFINDLEQRRSGGTGRLSASDTEALLNKLKEIERRLSKQDLSPSELEELNGLWHESYQVFQTFTRNANDFLGEMRRVEYEKLQQLDGFLRFKEALVRYLEEFSQGLESTKPLIQNLLHAWKNHGVAERLIKVLVEYNQKVPRPDGTFPEPNILAEEYWEQFDSIYTWYQPNGGVDKIRDMTIFSVELLVKQAARLVDRYRGGISRRQELVKLARRFALCKEISDCMRIAVEAFLIPQVRHVKGTFGVHTPRNMLHDWDSHTQPENIYLRAIKRGTRQRNNGKPIRDRRVEEEELRLRIRKEKDAEVAVINRIFKNGDIIVCENLNVETSEERHLILRIIRECQMNSCGSTRLIDGSTVILRTSVPDGRGIMVAPDGVLNMPAFVLLREVD